MKSDTWKLLVKIMLHKTSMKTNWIGLYTMFRREVQRTLRVVVQTLFAPVISAALYLFIFGTVIGSKIEDFAGVPYISFVFPGVLMLSVINASFASASSALYFMRFTRGIEEILITPFSYNVTVTPPTPGSSASWAPSRSRSNHT